MQLLYFKANEFNLHLSGKRMRVKALKCYVVSKLAGVYYHLSTLVAEFLVQRVAILGKPYYEFIYFPIRPLVSYCS